jgi:hypothetical protein
LQMDSLARPRFAGAAERRWPGRDSLARPSVAGPAERRGPGRGLRARTTTRDPAQATNPARPALRHHRTDVRDLTAAGGLAQASRHLPGPPLLGAGGPPSIAAAPCDNARRPRGSPSRGESVLSSLGS